MTTEPGSFNNQQPNPYGPPQQPQYAETPQYPQAQQYAQGQQHPQVPPYSQAPYPANPYYPYQAVPAKRPIVSPFLFFATFIFVMIGLSAPWSQYYSSVQGNDQFYSTNAFQMLAYDFAEGESYSWLMLGIFLTAIVSALVLVVIGAGAKKKPPSRGRLTVAWIFTILGFITTIGLFILLLGVIGSPMWAVLGPGLFIYSFSFTPAITGAIGMSTRRF